MRIGALRGPFFMLDSFDAADLHFGLVAFSVVGRSPCELLEVIVLNYEKFVARRNVAIERLEATIKDMRDREGAIVDKVAAAAFARQIKAAESRLESLRGERRAFQALVDEFKRLDDARAPKLPFGVEGPT